MPDRIAILDAGAQYGKLIDRAIREMCIESVLLPIDTPLSKIMDIQNPYKAIIISGGPGSVYDKNSPKCHSSIFKSYLKPMSSNENNSLPILGICYGFQLINYIFDGVIQAATLREDGVFSVSLDTHSKLYKGLDNFQKVLLTHGDSLIELGKNLKSNALSGQLVVGLEHEKYPIYGVQYHVEVNLSPCGKQILKNFCFDIANCTPNFTLPDRQLTCLNEIRQKVGDGNVLLLLSGGVDSCTCLALLKKCLKPEQIIALHIDNGFLRHKESFQIQNQLTKTLGVPIKVVDASLKFLQYSLPYTDFFDLTFPGVMECCLAKFINQSIRNGSPSRFSSINSMIQSLPNGLLSGTLDHEFDNTINCCCCCACFDNKDMLCKTFSKIGKMNPRELDPTELPPVPRGSTSITVVGGDDKPNMDHDNLEIKHCDCCCLHNKRTPSPADKTSALSTKSSVDQVACHCCAPNMAKLSETFGIMNSNIPAHKVYSFSSSEGSQQPPTSAAEIRIPLLSIEDALVKMGFGPHCFKNYDGTIMLKPLCRIINPELKRRIIGDIFVQVADEAINDMNLNPQTTFFCQGTLRPDLIESASHLVSTKAEVIKTHHNDTKLMRMLRAQGKVIEPLKDFHKDEVRCLARDLNLPTEIVEKQPFPGPGLAIRIICSNEPFMDKTFTETNFILRLLAQVLPDEYPKICHSNAIVQRLKDSLSLNDKETLSKIVANSKGITYSAILLPIKSVGVQGDKRSYSYVCALSCTIPGVKASAVPEINCTAFCKENLIPPSRSIPWSDLYALSCIIPKVCHNINRVVYVFGPEYKNPVTETVNTSINPLTLGMIRKADHLAHTILFKMGCTTAIDTTLSETKLKGTKSSISQMPVVLLPIQFDRTFDSYLGTEEKMLNKTISPPAHNIPPHMVNSITGSNTSLSNIIIPPFVTDDAILRSVVLRPFVTSDFMTGLSAVPGTHLDHDVLDEMVRSLTYDVEGISRVLYDLTNKPPGTTEWE